MTGWNDWRDILRETHVTVTPVDLELSRKYKVPAEVLATLKGDKEKYALAMAAAEDREIFQLVDYYREEYEVLGVPVGIRVVKGRLVAMFRSGLRVIVPDSLIPSNDPVEVLNIFRDYILVKVKRNGHQRVAVRLVRIVSRADRELAARVAEWFEENGYRPGLYFAVLLALNLSPELPFAFLYDVLARTLPAVNERIHSLYLTRPGVGKTYTAILYKHALGWDYLPKPPTPARLVGDARTGTITGVKHNGIWLDEFDKWAKGSDGRKLAEAIELMLTGMENCEWVREAGGALAPKTTRCVPFVITGNVNPLVETDPRSMARDIVGQVSEGAGTAFEERLAVAVLNNAVRAIEIVRHGIQGATPRTSYVRGVFALWRERLDRLGGPVQGGERFKRHEENVKRTLRALGLDGEPADRLAHELVYGVTITNERLKEMLERDGGGEQ